MAERTRIVEWPHTGENAPQSGSKFDGCEEWKLFYEFHESQNYVGLVKYCQQRVEKFPDDPDVQYHLGEAYVLNGEYEKAIQCLSAPYRQNSNNPNFQHVILDALFALGKSLQRRITVC